MWGRVLSSCTSCVCAKVSSRLGQDHLGSSNVTNTSGSSNILPNGGGMEADHNPQNPW